MIKFTTPVSYGTYPYRIGYKDNIMLLGSCFAESMGSMLDFYRFSTCVNPFGVLYNPVSIANAVERIIKEEPFLPSEVIKTGELYNSFFHHTSFARKTASEFIAHANESLKAASDYLNRATVVLITLGTAWCYREIETDKVVANCNKLNPALFKRELLSVHSIVESLKQIIALLTSDYPHRDKNSEPNPRQIIFTISPIRHLKDGLHGNTVSKASLHLALEQVIDDSNVTYFPSYEIMTDELRDYRFYAEDLVHPSNVAVKYIFEKFVENCFKRDIAPAMKLAEKISLAEQHVPFNRESRSYREFLAKTEELKGQFKEICRQH